MGTLVVALLLGLWASILLPGLVRARREAAPLNSVSTFERCMSMLAPADSRVAVRSSRPRGAGAGPGRHVLVLRDPAALATGRRRDRVLRRRRALLLRLSAATVAATVLGVVVGGLAWVATAVVGLSLVGYVVLLLELREREAEVRRKVRRLAPAGAPAAATAAGHLAGDDDLDGLRVVHEDDEAYLAPAAGQRSAAVEVRRWQT